MQLNAFLFFNSTFIAFNLLYSVKPQSQQQQQKSFQTYSMFSELFFYVELMDMFVAVNQQWQCKMITTGEKLSFKNALDAFFRFSIRAKKKRSKMFCLFLYVSFNNFHVKNVAHFLREKRVYCKKQKFGSFGAVKKSIPTQ